MAYQHSRSRYGPCDSFFVESADDGLYALRAEQRERARAIARMQQRALANELSRTTADEYQEDVMDHMEHMEALTMPDVNSIDIQTEIQWFMRPYLLDFLIEAHAAFGLLPETLFLAVNLLDRYCSRRVVYKKHYQLVGCAALLIAAKYGDRKERVPTIKELKSMCCSLYDDEMFTQMEWHVLQTLNWTVGHPTIDSFLQIALSETAFDATVEHMTLYICEIALFHREFVSTRPSVLARSALALARCILHQPQADRNDWAGAYDDATVLGLSNHLYQPSQVLSRKYASAHLSMVSTLVENFLREQAQKAKANAAATASQFAPPTPPHMQIDDVKSSVDGFLTPQTPQKNPFTSGIPNGCLTPPITPEGEQFNHGKPNSITSCMNSSTPSPMTIVQPQPQYQYQSYI